MAVLSASKKWGGSVIIREESPGDLEAINTVHKSSFPSPVEAEIVEALRKAGRLAVSLVCCENNLLVGHVAFSPVSIDGQAVGLGLGPVAVLSQHRRKGIAEKLIRAGMEASRKLGYGLVVVLGDPLYYCRFGFSTASNRGLRDEYGGGDAFQVIELRDDGIPVGGGTVQYAPEFAAAADAGTEQPKPG